MDLILHCTQLTVKSGENKSKPHRAPSPSASQHDFDTLRRFSFADMPIDVAEVLDHLTRSTVALTQSCPFNDGLLEFDENIAVFGLLHMLELSQDIYSSEP